MSLLLPLRESFSVPEPNPALTFKSTTQHRVLVGECSRERLRPVPLGAGEPSRSYKRGERARLPELKAPGTLRGRTCRRARWRLGVSTPERCKAALLDTHPVPHLSSSTGGLSNNRPALVTDPEPSASSWKPSSREAESIVPEVSRCGVVSFAIFRSLWEKARSVSCGV